MSLFSKGHLEMIDGELCHVEYEGDIGTKAKLGIAIFGITVVVISVTLCILAGVLS